MPRISSALGCSFPFIALFSLGCSSTDGTAPPGTNVVVPGDRPDYDSMANRGACAAATGAGTVHSGDVTADETWTAAAAPHVIESNVRILANVVIEPCADVVLNAGVGLQVGSTSAAGSLVTQGRKVGDQVEPVRFVSSTPGKKWGTLVVEPTGKVDLSYTVLASGNDPASSSNGGGTLRAYGASSASVSGPVSITANVRANFLLVDDSGEIGLNFLSYAGFTSDSTEVAVRRSGGNPIEMELGAVGTLPSVLLQGNSVDEIAAQHTRSGTLSTTFRNVGYPYRFPRPVYLQPFEDGAPAVLTVEPGVTLKFSHETNNSGIFVGTSAQRQGVIVANGTADKPIRFTSAQASPAAGDWIGIYYRYTPSTGNSIRNAIIEYAGRDSGAQSYGCGPNENNASVLLLIDRPDDAFIQNSTLRNGAGDTGILSGWRSNLDGPDFKATNTFEAMPACAVSRWQSESGCKTPDRTTQPECL